MMKDIINILRNEAPVFEAELEGVGGAVVSALVVVGI